MIGLEPVLVNIGCQLTHQRSYKKCNSRSEQLEFE